MVIDQIDAAFVASPFDRRNVLKRIGFGAALVAALVFLIPASPASAAGSGGGCNSYPGGVDWSYRSATNYVDFDACISQGSNGKVGGRGVLVVIGTPYDPSIARMNVVVCRVTTSGNCDAVILTNKLCDFTAEIRDHTIYQNAAYYDCKVTEFTPIVGNKYQAFVSFSWNGTDIDKYGDKMKVISPIQIAG